MIDSLITYLGYDFVQHALIAGTLAAILGAVVGYFVIIRNAGFAAHALAHIGFAGAAGAALLRLSSLEGMLLLTIGSGLVMGATGDKLQRKDLAIGMVLSAALGLGVLFLKLYSTFAGQTKAILFGNIFGVSSGQIEEMVALSVVSLAGLALFSRRLLFASMQPSLAEARGLSLPGLSMAFMTVLAISVTLASQVVGILLVFTLIIAPAGIALRICRSVWRGIGVAVAMAVIVTWAGLLLDCLTGYPSTFWITALFFVIYIAVELHCRFLVRSHR